MRKLLTTSLLLASTALCAQNAVVSFNDAMVKRPIVEQMNKLQVNSSVRLFKSKPMTNFPLVSAQSVAQRLSAYNGGMIARAYLNAQAVPGMWNLSVKVSGTEATIDMIVPYNNIPAVKGTISGGKMTVAKGQKVLDLQSNTGEQIDGVIGEINLQSGDISDAVFEIVDGRYTYVPQSEAGVFAIYGILNGRPALLDYLSDYSFSALENMPADYTCVSSYIWNYGFTPELSYFPVPFASMPANTELQWVSLPMAMENTKAKASWTYMAGQDEVTGAGESDGSLVMTLDAAKQAYSWPVVEVTNGNYTNTYGPEQSVLAVDQPSVYDGEDMGFTLSSLTNRLTFASYGKGGRAYDQETKQEVNVVGAMSMYQLVPSLTFSSANVILTCPKNASGELKMTVQKLVNDGKQLSFGDIIATSTASLSDFVKVQQWSQTHDFGTLSFNEFTVTNDGFEEQVESVTTGSDFVVIIEGLSENDVVIGQEANPDYAAAMLGMPETAWAIGENGKVYSLGSFADLFINFYGADFASTGIDSAQVAEEGSVVAAFNGNAFEVSYPEGVNAVQVVNVAGQTVAEYSLEGTSATIPAAALANGMYVLKFNNGAAVKVMR